MVTALVLVSSALPAFLLARSVTRRAWAAAAAAAACVAVPWVTVEPLERGDAIAYAVFVWAALALHRATAAPGLANDAAALAAVAAAPLVRSQLLVLLPALPLAVLVHELGSARGPGLGRRLGAGLRTALRRHRALAGAYVALVVLLAAVAAAGEVPDVLRDAFPQGLRRGFLRHAAELALALAILPAVVAAGWILAAVGRAPDRRRHAFASLAAATVVLVVLSAASIDLRFAAGEVRERYLVFALPLLLVALAAALSPLHRPRWSLGSVVLAWLALGLVLSRATGRVVDWFVMTDELLYERLAISVGRTGSPLPRVHGEVIESFNQLYPLVISRVYSIGLVPQSLHDAHVLNAFVITSAAVPAYLLARSVTGRGWLAFGVGVVSVCVPWVTLSSFLLTEVVAYPVFLWAVLALQRAVAAPGPANDAVALLAVGVAALARVQFLVLLAVLPLAVLVHELGSAEAPGIRARLGAGARRAVTGHRLLAAALAALLVGAIALAATGGVARALGTYGATARNPVPPGLALAFVQHLSQLALSLAILPFLVAVAWMLATVGRPADPRRHAFAALAGVTVLVVTLQVASFDVRFGEGVVRDRYLFYVVPVVLTALAAALVAPRLPRRSLLVPAALVVTGFATYGLPRYEKLNVDTPVSVLHDRIVELGGSTAGAQAGLVLATVVLVLLFVQGAALVGRAAAATALAAMVAFALPAETAYAFSRLFAVPGTSGRSLTADESGVFNWVDRQVGPQASVTMVPYPHLYGDYWAAVGFWWDLEFWNKSVVHTAHLDGAFQWTPSTFPKLHLEWDERGFLNVSPTPYVAQLAGDARFRVAGDVVWTERDTNLIDAGERWRLDWAANGIYADGWTRPDTPATVTVFPTPRQDGPLTRFVVVRLAPHAEGRPARLTSGLDDAAGVVQGEPLELRAAVCVRPDAAGELTLTVEGSGPLLGNPVDGRTYQLPRAGGAQVARIELAPERESGCRS